jgi:hypothetical protein
MQRLNHSDQPRPGQRIENHTQVTGLKNIERQLAMRQNHRAAQWKQWNSGGQIFNSRSK